MKKLFPALIAATCLFLAACAGSAGTLLPTSPILDPVAAQRTVYAAEGDYRIALIAANTYVNLPLCIHSKPPCATLAVVQQIQKAQPVARAALDAAESAVRTPGFGADIVNSAVTAGTAALQAFMSITNTLK